MAALLIAGVVVVVVGESPWVALKALIWGAFGSWDQFGYTLFYTTSFIFTGLAVGLAFHCGLFNIGGEGQAMMGGLGVAIVCLTFDGLHWTLLFPLAVIGAAAAGGAWAWLPGYLQAARGSHTVITTIMFNFLAAILLNYLLVEVLIAPNQQSPQTIRFDAAGHLPYAHDLLKWLGLKAGRSPLNITFLLALGVSYLVWLFLWRTRWGYALRCVGANEAAARYGGISPGRCIILAMTMAGALAGLMAVNEVMGSQHRLVLGFTAGFGFTGIAVALMGRNHPFGICFAALLFGALYQGGSELAFEVPTFTSDMVVVIQGLVILFCGALENIFRKPIAAFFQRRRRALQAAGSRLMAETFLLVLLLLDATMRVATPLILAAFAGMVAERSGVIDIGLEGKMLAGAFAAAAVAASTHSAWLGLGAAITVSMSFALLHAYACVTHNGNQVVSGMAINILVAGLGPTLAIAWFGLAGQTPSLEGPARFAAFDLPLASLDRATAFLGAALQRGGQRTQHSGLPHHRPGAGDRHSDLPHPLRPAPARHRRESPRGRYRWRLGGLGPLPRHVDLRPALRHGRRLSIDGARRRLRARHDGRQGILGAGRHDLRQVAPGPDRTGLLAIRICRCGADPPAGRCAAGYWRDSRASDPGFALCFDGHPAGWFRRPRGGAEGQRHPLRERQIAQQGKDK